jgi:heme/copper-type cytochrome/quinol oxidase subunit 3
MDSRFLRIAYAVQFVVTMMAVFEVWGQVGGQSHVDLMPWYAKLLLAVGVSLAGVKATAAAVEHDKLRNKRTVFWLSAALALMIAMGALTYYEHLHEPTDNEEDAPPQVVS